jgi:hypothetical protein
MIQLANDPNASRTSQQRGPNDGKPSAFSAQRRSGHAWPFLSRYAARPARDESQKPSANSSGS